MISIFVKSYKYWRIGNRFTTNQLYFFMFKLATLLLLLFTANAVYDILSFGAVPNSDTLKDQYANQKAILEAIRQANSSKTERVVRIPNKKFYSMPLRVENVHNISIQISGKLIASRSVAQWPKLPEMQKFYEDFISFRRSTHIEISGGGKIDGRGFHWWVILFHNDQKILPDQNGRPMLLHFINCNFTSVHDLVLKNSPQFHLKYDECHDGTIYNLDIKVNTTAQINLVKRFAKGPLIMFPFNTDGIDPSGARFHIYNITVQNYDDVVVPKPLDDNFDCTRDMLIENATVKMGIGMAIGSLSPSAGRDCIRNITAKNWRMIRPIKSIYVKSNPGHEGTGIIQNLHFKNFTMDRPIWWCIYIGPQQMKEPDGDGPGCMFYPFGKGVCETEPRVTMRNITVQDVRVHNSLFYPYTIRCNVTNPCKDINFYNVQTDSWRVGQKHTGYLCEYVIGKGRNNVPPIHCLEQQPSQSANQLESIIQSQSVNKHKQTIFEKAFQDSLTPLKVSRLIFQEIWSATHEIGYFQEDDEVDYHLHPTEVYKNILSE